jgi:putative tricarboxylic transport membrane protein
MRRDTFLKSMAALAAAGTLPLSARAAANLKMMIPANPGGGWDTTGRALGKALQERVWPRRAPTKTRAVPPGHRPGAVRQRQPRATRTPDGDGRGDAGRHHHRQAAGVLTQATPIARLTSEYNVFVLPPIRPLKTMKDVVEQLKKDPGSVKWGGGSRGSTEHIAACMIARERGRRPEAKINYVAFRGGGEATAAILGGNVTVGGSGYSEFQPSTSRRQDARHRRHVRKAPEGHRRAHAEGAGLSTW